MCVCVCFEFSTRCGVVQPPCFDSANISPLPQPSLRTAEVARELDVLSCQIRLIRAGPLRLFMGGISVAHNFVEGFWLDGSRSGSGRPSHVCTTGCWDFVCLCFTLEKSDVNDKVCMPVCRVGTPCRPSMLATMFNAFSARCVVDWFVPVSIRV